MPSCTSTDSQEARVYSGQAFFRGYAVASLWDDSLHRFIRLQHVTDSTPAQIRVIAVGEELKATVSIAGDAHPFDVFLFSKEDYFTGNDSASFAYYSADSLHLTWGQRSDSGNSTAIYARQ